MADNKQDENLQMKPARGDKAGSPAAGGPLFGADVLARLGKLGRDTLRHKLTTAADLEKQGRGPVDDGHADRPAPTAERDGSQAPRLPHKNGSPARMQAAAAGKLTIGFHSPVQGGRTLPELCPGCERVTGEGHALWLIDRPIAEVAPEYEQVQKDYARALFGGGTRATPQTLHKSVRPLLECPGERIAYIDIETCGLQGSAVFLIGLLQWDERRGLVLRQFLARDYSQERAILMALWHYLQGQQTIVSFNGRTFDLPFLLERSAVCCAEPECLPPHHVDLLHESRRRWKTVLPNCRLQTIERFVCGRIRTGDIPGSDIPAAYHDFVRTGDARDMRQILYHNAIDLLTLAEIVVHIIECRDAEWL